MPLNLSQDNFNRSQPQRLTEIHDVIPADSTIIHNYIPCPKSHCIPLIKVSLESAGPGTVNIPSSLQTFSCRLYLHLLLT